MAKQISVDGEISAIQRMVDGSDADLAEFIADHPYLRSANEARDDLRGLIVGLEDLRAGRVVPHKQIVADIDERRGRHRTQAAE